uniref:Uncharacterized protein n=1 Tax=Rhizophora mucronata TaxID=61149 RepID=A0A2P2IP31_RHIMU
MSNRFINPFCSINLSLMCTILMFKKQLLVSNLCDVELLNHKLRKPILETKSIFLCRICGKLKHTLRNS